MYVTDNSSSVTKLNLNIDYRTVGSLFKQKNLIFRTALLSKNCKCPTGFILLFINGR